MCLYGARFRCHKASGGGGSVSAQAVLGPTTARGRVRANWLLKLVKRFCMTRLETRTKESNMYASLRVRNPRAKRKRELVREGVINPRIMDRFLAEGIESEQT